MSKEQSQTPFQEAIKVKDQFEVEVLKPQVWHPRGPVWGCGLGLAAINAEIKQPAIVVYLDAEPTPKLLERFGLPKTYQDIAVRYKVTGKIVAAGASSA